MGPVLHRPIVNVNYFIIFNMLTDRTLHNRPMQHPKIKGGQPAPLSIPALFGGALLLALLRLDLAPFRDVFIMLGQGLGKDMPARAIRHEI